MINNWYDNKVGICKDKKNGYCVLDKCRSGRREIGRVYYNFR